MKIQYSQAKAAGLEPQSMGTPWQNTGVAPYYLASSPYGPTQIGTTGPQIVKPAFLGMDVMANWGFTWNAQDAASNFFPDKTTNNLGFTAAKLLASNLSIGAKPGIMGILQTDPSTLGPSKLTNASDALDFLLSNFGQTNLAFGLGAYTPLNKQTQNQANLKTAQQKKEYEYQLQQQRQASLLNWLGLTRGLTNVNTPSNVTIATTELNKRIKAAQEKAKK
jgi:hypothetical protein